MAFATRLKKLRAPLWQGGFAEYYRIVLDVGSGPKPSSPELYGMYVSVDVKRHYLLRYGRDINENPDQLLTLETTQMPRLLSEFRLSYLPRFLCLSSSGDGSSTSPSGLSNRCLCARNDPVRLEASIFLLVWLKLSW